MYITELSCFLTHCYFARVLWGLNILLWKFDTLSIKEMKMVKIEIFDEKQKKYQGSISISV